MKRQNKYVIRVIASIGVFISGLVLGWYIIRRSLGYKLRVEKDNRVKMTEFYFLLVRWNRLKNNNQMISDWLKKHNISKIAIYGMKELGFLLYEELKDSDINICYAIDMEAEKIVCELNVLKPEEISENVDAIIVTAIHHYDDIEECLKIKGCGEAISLEDIIFEMECE